MADQIVNKLNIAVTTPILPNGNVSEEQFKAHIRNLREKGFDGEPIIDGIVTERLDARPTIVVAHSLGTVVMYNILRNTSVLNVPLFVTLGSPLGIRAIRRRFRPLRYPANVGPWINAFDERDVVALNPLDQKSFPVTPQISNINNIDNQTDNRHGIIGYLDKPEVTQPILSVL